MRRRDFLKTGVLPALAGASGLGGCAASAFREPEAGSLEAEVLHAMRRVVRHMDEQVSWRGAYVWAYLPDMSRTWGEMEARRSMCWIQPPGTPTVAHAFLDAWQVTGDDLFYRAAERTALALVAAQLPAGGWNYIHDFAGEEALRRWYATTGRNGWRLEEFHHYYGNATFDDAATTTAAQVLLRTYLARRDPRFREPLYKAIDFILAAQYRGGMADGGWPQRWPPVPGVSQMTAPPGLPPGAVSGMEDGDYTGHVTWNDDVAGENIKFLLMCVVSLGETRLVEPIQRAMDCMLRMQQPAPQAGWGLQHLAREQGGRPAGAPAAARSYEPRALATHTTANNIQQLFHYFRMTGDEKYLARIPEAIAWLESCPLSPQMLAENPLLKGRSHPTFIELGSNRPRFVHRFGSNVHNGAYYFDYDHRDTLSHYSAGRNIRLDDLRKTYQQLIASSPAERARWRETSPLFAGGKRALPALFSLREVDFPDLFSDAVQQPAIPAEQAVRDTLAGLAGKDYWLTPLPAVTNPFRGDGPAAPYSGREYMSNNVGDLYDTSPYDPARPPRVASYEPARMPLGITTTSFVSQLGQLTAFLASRSRKT